MFRGVASSAKLGEVARAAGNDSAVNETMKKLKGTGKDEGMSLTLGRS